LRSRRSLGAKIGFIVFNGQVNLLRRRRAKEKKAQKMETKKTRAKVLLTRDTQVASVLQNHHLKVYRDVIKGK
jgi:hypothetical protein